MPFWAGMLLYGLAALVGPPLFWMIVGSLFVGLEALVTRLRKFRVWRR